VNTGILRKCENINYSAWVLNRATTGHLVSESRYVEDALIITPIHILLAEKKRSFGSYFMWNFVHTFQIFLCVNCIYSNSLFENMERICDEKYVPTPTDVLRARVRTNGIIETHFKINDVIIRYVNLMDNG
jgi:guanine nucleotide-binding protein subunit alpha